MIRIDEARLDNPIWYSLTERHSHLAVGGAFARRYLTDVAVFAALADESPDAFRELAEIVSPGEAVALVGMLPPADSTEWQLLRQIQLIQMVCEQPLAALKESIPLTTLTEKDVPEMLALVDITHPGPFKSRTIEMGNYFAIHQDGELAAMAGERFLLDGYTEISAVCTHPTYQKRGYARYLVSYLMEKNLKAGQIPFLHVMADNFSGIRLYESLHFWQRAAFTLSIIQRT